MAKTKYSRFKKIGASVLSIFFPLGAAIGKAFGNSFGSICFILVFTVGLTSSTDITTAMLTWPILLMAGICFLGVAFISLFMEGANNWRFFYQKLTGKEKARQVSTRPQSHFFRKFLGFFLFPWMYLIPLAGALAKGATMGFATYVILGALFGTLTGPIGLAFLGLSVICGIAVAAVSLGKEGKDTFLTLKKSFNKIIGVNKFYKDDKERHVNHFKRQLSLELKKVQCTKDLKDELNQSIDTYIKGSSLNPSLNASLNDLDELKKALYQKIRIQEKKDKKDEASKKYYASLYKAIDAAISNPTSIDKTHETLKEVSKTFITFLIKGFFYITGIYFIGRLTKNSKKLNELLSWIPSVIAAIGKGLGNAFGAVKISSLISSTFLANPLALTSPWNIPIILVVGICEFIISMAFEGNRLRKHSQKALNHVLDIENQDIEPKKTSAIGKAIQRQIQCLPQSFRQILGWGIVGIAGIAKGATMGFGAITTLTILDTILGGTGILSMVGLTTTPLGIFLVALIAFAALSVFIVSLTKEGNVFLKWINKNNDSKEKSSSDLEMQPLLSGEHKKEPASTLDNVIGVYDSTPTAVAKSSSSQSENLIPPFSKLSCCLL